MFSRGVIVLTLLSQLIISAKPVAGSEDSSALTLQLDGYHQFRFAGYYAADLHGYYAEAGLKVNIRESASNLNHELALTKSTNTFATADSTIVQRWGTNVDLCLVAIIHQRNTHALFVRDDSPLHTIADLVSVPPERRVGPATLQPDLAIGLLKNGVDPTNFFTATIANADVARFVRGEIDVLPGSLVDEPNRLRLLGVSVRPLALKTHATLVPGDTLVCSGKLWREQPQLVLRFREASLRGWQYALTHQEEMIGHILASRQSPYRVTDHNTLAYEARVVSDVMDPDRFPIGSIDTNRLTTIANLLKTNGVPAQVRTDLIADERHLVPWFQSALIASVMIVMLGGFALGWRRRQRREETTRAIAAAAAKVEHETERMELEQQTSQTQRHESLGLLASGVAHDFNNILSAIRGNAELIARQVPENGQKRMERLLQAVDRASGLVRQILAYSGRGRVENRPLDLGAELQEIVSLLSHALPPGINIELSISPDTPRVLFDPAQFQQVAVNLIMNAAESYEGRGGTVHVMLDTCEDRVRLRICDSGCGMDAETAKRIYDPYFTTKEHGHGLGLAAVRGIISGASGKIDCVSTPGSGTTFTLTLIPCIGETKRGETTSVNALPDNHRTVVVADDDELVREATVAQLTQIGFKCLQVGSGAACLKELHEHREETCLLVLDCRMPDGDGPSVVRELRERGDRIPIILMSGMIGATSLDTILQDKRTRFLAKPFSYEQLKSTVNTLFTRSERDVSKELDDSSRTAMVIADVIRLRHEDNNRIEARRRSDERKKKTSDSSHAVPIKPQ